MFMKIAHQPGWFQSIILRQYGQNNAKKAVCGQLPCTVCGPKKRGDPVCGPNAVHEIDSLRPESVRNSGRDVIGNTPSYTYCSLRPEEIETMSSLRPLQK